MKKRLSICIPTMNRPGWLMQAIRSIIDSDVFLDEIEVCISNNCSESNYSEVEQFIQSVSKLCKIDYVRHHSRVTLDENHHFVKKMADGDYIYFLGDDDYFLNGQIAKLLDFLETEKPDLAIFNGILVDGNDAYLGRHFNLPSKQYFSTQEAFLDLRDKGMFGAVLVRKDFLNDQDFIRLYGTSHAYGCFWLKILNNYESAFNFRIFVPDFPCIALRCSEKNYNHVNVYYRDIPYEIAVFKRFVNLKESQDLIFRFEQTFNKKIIGIRFMCELSIAGSDLTLIKTINPAFYLNYFIRVELAHLIAQSSLYKFIKSFKRYCRGKLVNFDKSNRASREDLELIAITQSK